MNVIPVWGAAWRRRLALLAVTLLATLGGLTVGAATPAQASAGSCIWTPIISGNQVVSWICIPILYQNEPEPDPCLCPDWALEIAVNPVLPVEVQSRYLNTIASGLALLGDAAVADPRTADRLRTQARNAFVEAGRVIGGADIRLGTTGIADRNRGVIGPTPDPWLAAGAGYLVDGLRLIQRAQAQPFPDPLVAAAMTQFQLAYDQLAGGPATP